MPKKIDFKEKFYDVFHAEEWKVDFVDVPKLNYIEWKWKWHPETKDSAFNETLKFLWWLAFSMKFRLKRIWHETFEDYSMPPTQAEWTNMWKDKTQWDWKLYLLQPNTITKEILKKSMEVAKMKQQEKILPSVSLKSIKPWLCVQTLHVWSYEDEKKTIKLLEKEAKKQWYIITWEHREIYLNDPRRTPAPKLKTIIRYKVSKA